MTKLAFDCLAEKLREAARRASRNRYGRAGGRSVAILPPQVTAKLAIYQAMREAGLTQAALAERLNCDPRHVRRLLDLDHRSRLDQLEAALSALGKRLALEVRDAA